jgi:hypothetical protein
MTRTEADENRAVGIQPARPTTGRAPVGTAAPQRSRARRTLEIAWRVIVVLVLLSGLAYVLATGKFKRRAAPSPACLRRGVMHPAQQLPLQRGQSALQRLADKPSLRSAIA